MSITVYSKPNCVQCKATYRVLDRQGLEYEVIDMSQDESALEFVKGLGHLAAPVVVVGDEHWSGYRPDRVRQLCIA